MEERILQLNFKFNIPRKEYDDAAKSLADDFANIPGLVWKIWIMNEKEKEAGGIYFFEDQVSLETYLDSPLAEKVSTHPALSEMSIKRFSIMPDVTAVTRGPVEIHAGHM